MKRRTKVYMRRRRLIKKCKRAVWYKNEELTAVGLNAQKLGQ